MAISKKTAIKNLKKKGFVEDQRHHIYLTYFCDGKMTTAYTYFSHSGMDISDNLIGLIKKQLKLNTNQETKDLLCCPMNQEQYSAILSTGFTP